VLTTQIGVVLLAALLSAQAFIQRDAADLPATHPVSTIKQSDGTVMPVVNDAFENVVVEPACVVFAAWHEFNQQRSLL